MGIWPSPTALLDELPLVFVDVETTGLDPATGDRVCEIALLRVQGTQELARFTSLIHPQRSMHPGAMAVHGISDAMLADAPPFPALLPQIWSLLQQAVLVAHNARFDLGFLRHEWQLAGQELPALAVVDTLALAQARYRFRHNSLGAIARELGLQPAGLHRAMADVDTTWQIWQRFIADLQLEGAVTLAHVMYPNPRRPVAEMAAMITALQEAIPTRQPLRMRYQPDRAPETIRVVQPLEMYYDRGHGYLRAFCHLRQEERHFRFDRIAELSALPEGVGSDALTVQAVPPPTQPAECAAPSPYYR
ncbi:MAG: exonuclease domain-containing protein [Candidatus Tectimicrobiota bacterium]